MECLYFAVHSCRDPGWHYPEQHSGSSRDREGARGDTERDAGSRDQFAGSGLRLPARYCVSVHRFGPDYPGPYWKHQVRPDIHVLLRQCAFESNLLVNWLPTGQSTGETWWTTSLLTTKAPESSSLLPEVLCMRLTPVWDFHLLDLKNKNCEHETKMHISFCYLCDFQEFLTMSSLIWPGITLESFLADI